MNSSTNEYHLQIDRNLFFRKLDFLVNIYRCGKRLKKIIIGQRVVFISTPATSYGGGQQYLYRLLEGADPESWMPIFVYYSFEDADTFKNELKKRGAIPFEMDNVSNRFLHYIAWLLLLFSLRPAFVHVNGYNEKTMRVLFLLRLCKKILNIKLCITSHLRLFSAEAESIIHTCQSHSWRLFLPANYSWHMRDYYRKKLCFTSADLILFVNKIHHEIYQPLLHLDRDKVIYVLNGIDTDTFNPDSTDSETRKRLRNGFEIQDDDIVIIGVGNLIQQKRFDLFLDIIADLVASCGQHVKGMIVGAGELHDNLRKYSSEKHIARQVILTGYRSDIPKLLNISDIFLMTSEDEGLPYALLEAKAAGLPTVAYSVGGIDEVIQHDRDGYITKFGDNTETFFFVKKLINDSSLRIKMGSYARQDIITRFGIAAMQSKTLTHCKKIGLEAELAVSKSIEN